MRLEELSIQLKAGARALHPKAHHPHGATILGATVIDGDRYSELYDLRRRYRPAGTPIEVHPAEAHALPLVVPPDACRAITADLGPHLEELAAGVTALELLFNPHPAAAASTTVRTISAALLDALHEANQATWRVPELALTNFQALRYRPPGAKGWHCDGTLDVFRPWLGSITALSAPEDYTGGELEIDGHAPFAIPQGVTIVLPGRLPHRVHPVSAGERWTIVGFACSAAPHRR